MASRVPVINDYIIEWVEESETGSQGHGHGLW